MSTRRRSPLASRLGGAVALVIAVLATVSGPRLFAPPWSGGASRAPLPEPPAVGACLVFGSGPAPEPETGGRPADTVAPPTPTVGVVPCAGPHQAEVVWSQRADAPAIEALARFSSYLERPFSGPDRSMGGLTEDILGACWGAAQSYANPAPVVAEWFPVPPRVHPAVLAAPPGQGAGRWRWLACVIEADDGNSWSGSVRWQSSEPASRPATLAGNCETPGDVGFVACDQPHRAEVLGWPDSQAIASSVDVPVACLTHARKMTGRYDPTFGGRLEISVVTTLPGVFSTSLPACVARLVGDGDLTGSVIGIKDGTLPLR